MTEITKGRLSAFHQGVTDAEMFAGFGRSDTGVSGETVEMLETLRVRPDRKLRAA